MTSVSNAIFQMKSTEHSVVFPLRKIFKNLIAITLLTKYYPVRKLLCKTYIYEHLKLHELAYLPLC